MAIEINRRYLAITTREPLRDYAGALAELEMARRALPNDPRLFELAGYILRRRGQQNEGLRNLQHAVELARPSASSA